MQFNSFNMDDDVTFTNLMCHKCITTKKKKKKGSFSFSYVEIKVQLSAKVIFSLEYYSSSKY